MRSFIPTRTFKATINMIQGHHPFSIVVKPHRAGRRPHTKSDRWLHWISSFGKDQKILWPRSSEHRKMKPKLRSVKKRPEESYVRHWSTRGVLTLFCSPTGKIVKTGSSIFQKKLEWMPGNFTKKFTQRAGNTRTLNWSSFFFDDMVTRSTSGDLPLQL